MVLTKSSPGREHLAHHIYSANKCALYLDRLKNMHMHYINCNFEAGKELLADNSKKSTLRLRLGWSECSAACACVVMSSYDNGTFHHWENLRNKANHFTLVNKILDLDNLLIEKFVPKKVSHNFQNPSVGTNHWCFKQFNLKMASSCTTGLYRTSATSL